MHKKLVICGYGWLGGYLGDAMPTDYSIYATTRSEEKAHLISQNNVQGIVFALGEDTCPLLNILEDATLVLNIPPGRRNTQLDDFTANMLALIDDAIRANVAHIVFISTTSVYGDTRDEVLTEQATTLPETASAKAHVSIEQHLLSQVSSQVKVTIVRLAGLTGPDRHPVNSLSGRTLSAGNKRVNLVHVYDVVAGLKTLITADNHTIEGTNVLHLCSLQHPKRGDYYTKMAQQKDIPAPVFSDSALPPTGKCIHANASWDLLGITPQYANPDDMV